jgi:hypothetical protein
VNPTKSPHEIAKQNQEKAKQLRIEYRKVFTSESGKAILADLFGRYGFDAEGVERPSARAGMRAEDVFLADGMKEPVRYILRQLEPVSDQPKPTEAHSNNP